jgi:hypothetical protein
MLELTSYGLTGLVAMLIVVFFFVFKDDCALAKETPSLDPIDNAHLLRTPMPDETGPGAEYGDRVQHGQERRGTLHG